MGVRADGQLLDTGTLEQLGGDGNSSTLASYPIDPSTLQAIQRSLIRHICCHTGSYDHQVSIYVSEIKS